MRHVALLAVIVLLCFAAGTTRGTLVSQDAEVDQAAPHRNPFAGTPLEAYVDFNQGPTALPDDLGGPFSILQHGIHSMIGGFDGFMNSISPHSVTAVVYEDMCLGFSSWSAQTNHFVVQGLPPQHLDFFVTTLFDDMAWIFGGDTARLKAEILDFEYSQGSNWTQQRVQYAPSNTSHYVTAHVFLNRDPVTQNANIVVTKFHAGFTLAPTLVYWRKSSEGWFGRDAQTHQWMVKKPHVLTMADITALDVFFQIVSAGNLGAYYDMACKFPKMKSCNQGGESLPCNASGAVVTGHAIPSKPLRDGKRVARVAQQFRQSLLAEEAASSNPTTHGSHFSRNFTQQQMKFVQWLIRQVEKTGSGHVVPSAPIGSVPIKARQLLIHGLTEMAKVVQDGLPSAKPPDAAALVSDLRTQHFYKYQLGVPSLSDAIATIDQWGKTYGWSKELIGKFTLLAMSTSGEWSTNAFTAAKVGAPSVAVYVIGASRFYNQSLELAFTHVEATGDRIQQYFGDGTHVPCPAQDVQQQNVHHIFGVCVWCSGGSRPVSMSPSCTQLIRSDAPLILHTTEFTCDWFSCGGNSPVTLNFDSCRHVASVIDACKKPMTPEQLASVTATIELAARPVIMQTVEDLAAAIGVA